MQKEILVMSFILALAVVYAEVPIVVISNATTTVSSGGSSYNVTYETWSYNQSNYSINNLNTSYGKFWYNMSNLTWVTFSYNQTPTLNEVLNPTNNKTFTMAGHFIDFLFTNPTASTNGGAFTIEASGNFNGDLVHIHQHTGTPFDNAVLVTLESTHTKVIPLVIKGANETAINISGGGDILINGNTVQKWLYNQSNLTWTTFSYNQTGLITYNATYQKWAYNMSNYPFRYAAGLIWNDTTGVKFGFGDATPGATVDIIGTNANGTLSVSNSTKQLFLVNGTSGKVSVGIPANKNNIISFEVNGVSNFSGYVTIGNNSGYKDPGTFPAVLHVSAGKGALAAAEFSSDSFPLGSDGLILMQNSTGDQHIVIYDVVNDGIAAYINGPVVMVGTLNVSASTGDKGIILEDGNITMDVGGYGIFWKNSTNKFDGAGYWRGTANALRITAPNNLVTVLGSPSWNEDITGFLIQNYSNYNAFKMMANGTFEIATPNGIGWGIITYAGACNTGCAYGCVFGLDDGGSADGTPVGCDNAAANWCLCSGRN